MYCKQTNKKKKLKQVYFDHYFILLGNNEAYILFYIQYKSIKYHTTNKLKIQSITLQCFSESPASKKDAIDCKYKTAVGLGMPSQAALTQWHR